MTACRRAGVTGRIRAGLAGAGLAWVGLASVAVALPGCARNRPPAVHSPVYVYLIDTLRRDHLHCYGYPRQTSPAIDALAADGVLFTQVTSSSSWTRPSVASLFTGLPALFHGVEGRAGVLPDTVRTWAEAMSELGYATTGLLTNPNVETSWGFGQGFDQYRLLVDPGAGSVRSDALHRQWEALPPATGRPAFQYLHALDPHAPYRPVRKYRMAFAGRRVLPGIDGVKLPAKPTPEQLQGVIDLYDGEVLQNDAAVGSLVATLRARGEYDRAWIVVTSDHGEEFWEHGIQGHGHGVWENLLRVPLVIKPPGGRDGAASRALRAVADRPMSLHSVADLLGPLLDTGWKPLGLDNATRLGVDPEVAARWLAPAPVVSKPRGSTTVTAEPALRIASVQLDQRSEVMLEQQGVKLVWRDQSREGPALRYLCFDLQRDPGEVDDLWPAQAPAAGRSLQSLLHRLADEAAWGIELTYVGPDSATPLLLRGQQPMRQAWVPPGGHPPVFDFRFMANELRWTPSPGERIFVRLNPGSGLALVPPATGSAGGAGGDAAGDARRPPPEFALWPMAAGGLPAAVPLRVRAVGPARFELGDVEPMPQPSAEALEALRALGYVQ